MLLSFCVALASSVQNPQDVVDVLEVRCRVLTLRQGMSKEEAEKAIQPKAKGNGFAIIGIGAAKPDLMLANYHVGSKCVLCLSCHPVGAGLAERWILDTAGFFPR
jgi:hypothetical protein